MGYVPATAARLVVTFVASGLGDKGTNPGFDVGCCFHVFVICEDISVFNHDVYHRGVFEVLTKAANRNTIAAMACDLGHNQLVNSWSWMGGLHFVQRYCMIVV
jgi:hypothetical protein